jgi:hypothetical protein
VLQQLLQPSEILWIPPQLMLLLPETPVICLDEPVTRNTRRRKGCSTDCNSLMRVFLPHSAAKGKDLSHNFIDSLSHKPLEHPQPLRQLIAVDLSAKRDIYTPLSI